MTPITITHRNKFRLSASLSCEAGQEVQHVAISNPARWPVNFVLAEDPATGEPVPPSIAPVNCPEIPPRSAHVVTIKRGWRCWIGASEGMSVPVTPVLK